MRNPILTPAAMALGMLLAARPAIAEEATAAPECGGLPAQLKPIMKTHTLAPYPTESQMFGEEGLVKMSIHIDKDGVPDSVRVTASSSFKRLDDTAVAYIKRVWRWEPLRPECQETGATLPVTYSWNLTGSMPMMLYASDPRYPAEAREKNITGWGTVTVDISESGKPIAAHVITTTGSAILDDAMQSIMMAQTYNPKTVNGTAQAFTGRVQIMFRLAPPKAVPPGTAEAAAP